MSRTDDSLMDRLSGESDDRGFIALADAEAVVQRAMVTLFVWQCQTCGCLWRDNLDTFVSLLDAEQKSCAECEHKPTATACKPFAITLLRGAGAPR